MIQKKDLYSVYTHTSPSGKVYVGISNNPKRRWGTYGAPYLCKSKSGNYAQSCFANAILKYGWDEFKHEILLDEISFSEALYAEKYLIRWYKMHNMSYNMSDGGEYYSGSRKPLSEERKQQIKVFMNTNHPMKGRHHTPEAKAKMSEAAKNRNFTPEEKAIISENISKAHKGKHYVMSEEGKRSLALRNKKMAEEGRMKHRTKEVHQYDFNGNYIASYQSVTEAANTIQRKGGDISNCANGKHLSVGGYIWRYYKAEHIDVSNYVIYGNGLHRKALPLKNKANSKRINQYTKDGEYMATFNSAAEAKRAGYTGQISMCCLHKPGHNLAGGYKWEFDTIKNRKTLSSNKK